MSDRKLAKAVQAFIRQIWRLHRSITKAFVTWLLRTALILNRRSRFSPSGFVLPTVVLLVLVVALTAGALTYRAFNTSTRSIAETQNRVIYNAATPAVDRARAKLEYLFDANKDVRYPGGVPSERFLASMLLNTNVTGIDPAPRLVNGQDPYTIPGETRIDINGDGIVDNAWRYRADTDGNGSEDATVVYSVVLSIPPDQGNVPGSQRLILLSDAERATGRQGGTLTGTPIEGAGSRVISYARSGPLSNASISGCKTSGTSGAAKVEKGWYPDPTNSSILRKNFQVDALVIPDSAGTPGGGNNFSTLEFQQDRILNRGNKWGAWFRNDLEIFPGPQFNWNGAMHTEGSLIIGGSSFNAYLISSPNSCLYNPPSSSEITVTDTTDPDTNQPFKGLIVSGTVKDNAYGGSSLIYLPTQTPTAANSKRTLTSANDWANGSSPFQITSDPLALLLRSGYQSRAADTTNATYFQTNNTFGERFRSNAERPPYVDDTYRADNRYGPKVKYDDDPATGRIPPGTRLGSLITGNDKLTGNDPVAGAEATSVGLDGYWERRARNEGLRVLVGQRLELGNTNGWVAPRDQPNDGDLTVPGNQPQDPKAFVLAGNLNPSDLRTAPTGSNNTVTITIDASTADPYTSDNEGDPLYPPYGNVGSHEAIQRRALRDNIPAVQATTVYHAAIEKDYPVACLASTAHPGSPFSLRQSINFVPTFFVDSTDGGNSIPPVAPTTSTDTVLLTDFFNGRGTNGWEFDPPRGTATAFATDMNNADSEVRIALQNLANFAGDHVSDLQTGAFPPTQEAGRVHPYPELTMWGNFSNLRRTLAQLTAGTTYENLSPADKTYLQTAACTVGMLAYNIDRVQRFDPRNYQNDAKTRPGQSAIPMQKLGEDIYKLMDGIVDEAAGNYEVLPRSQLATYGYANSYTASAYNPRDYDRVPAEAYLGKLREYYIATSGTPSFNEYKLRLAELIFSHFQIRRDRTYGFRASLAANTWNYNPYITLFPITAPTKTLLWSSACDPNTFALNSSPQARLTGLAAAGQSVSISDPITPLQRLGLSRLCGTVIPAGAERVGSGDTGLPQRNKMAVSATTPDIPTEINVAYLPKASGSYPDGAKPSPSPAAFKPLETAPFTESPLRKSPPTPTEPYLQETYLRATVAPKWPSLYYLFPEFNHNHDGTVVSGLSGTQVNVNGVIDTDGDGVGIADATPEDNVDQRQPTGTLATPGTTPVPPGTSPIPNNTLRSAFQPWAEPYITDTYISSTVNSTATYRVVDSLAPAIIDASQLTTYETPTTSPITYSQAGTTYSYRYKSFYNPIDDRPVAKVAVQPRKLPTSAGFTTPFPLQANNNWELPVSTLPTSPPTQNTPPNRIVVPNGNITSNGVVAVTPFLDRVIFNGREWQPTRVMDFDLGMLRRTSPRNTAGEAWLPVSGIVYAFREDAVREDAISRPASGTYTDARNASAPTDPPVQQAYSTGPSANAEPKLSPKAVDAVPDPDRRPHGFRLRNGAVLRRHPNTNIPDDDNIRGLSFFTDNPVYIMGDFNLHNKGADDDSPGTRVEEFLEQLPTTGLYNETQFYTNRVNRDPDFAEATKDRWRPSEILADAISVVSNTLCDGSVLDTFMTASSGSGATLGTGTYSGRTTTDSGATLPNGFYPYRAISGDNSGGADVYDGTRSGLFGPGCSGSSKTTFLNQNRPNTALPSAATTGWTWMRENPADAFSSVKLSRNGQGMVFPAINPNLHANPTTPYPSLQNVPSLPRVAGTYNAAPINGSYFTIEDGRSTQGAQDTRVNTIIVSGLVPSRVNQSYGGMHNFPRFLEGWGNLWFSGSFLQLSFSNYATAPFDLDAVEPGDAPEAAERISYYGAPQRLWGYDVALQLSPAGPAAARFVTANKDRNEFYNEPAANDPYISNLCRAAKANPPNGVNLANLNCPA
ncbi:hormogonium polysaccharide biosynthesis protein HpsA [Kovacikia minuta CCNUW1]|uniref:hormogonium polysaccharide biosynthesis protein HpsA n=1 Tax=Kovacikia minuta TaxID=2931930 RepID=UPI001CCD05A0|nr:hormogonium polysaccharide biosynthesis protein HpsA [Kovacikia minuta]UBF24499.1 hormogonium polysaccharide biosynthesis protein HpsA [Kovacikia minuta CCNUW1]